MRSAPAQAGASGLGAQCLRPEVPASAGKQGNGRSLNPASYGLPDTGP